MSKPHIDINRVEFVITRSCTGKCKHCSVALDSGPGKGIDANAAAAALSQLAERYTIESILTFGGEPLLYGAAVCAIHSTARDAGISERGLITNGFFTRDNHKIEAMAAALVDAGVNDIALSVDAFHQEDIPVEPVLCFAKALYALSEKGGLKLRTHPAWLVNKDHANPYNDETKRLLKIFRDAGIKESRGNNIFPAGNANTYLRDYFSDNDVLDLTVPCGSAPYTSRPDQVGCVSISPNGDLEICFPVGNIYEQNALDILDRYDPYSNPAMRVLLEDGVEKLLEYAQNAGHGVDVSHCYTACDVCRKVMKVAL
ncbi:MAG: radical SAM protein [Defluviitaleaceae bacterium]|nr:radical SAM protein [Defluviitaleaceae bacterium]